MTFVSKIFQKSYCAISHVDDGIVVVQMARKEGELQIEDSWKAPSWDVFTQKYSSKQPVCIVVNDQSVVQKTVQHAEVSEAEVLRMAFPNIVASEFYSQIVHQKTQSFVAICRKKTLDDLLQKYADQGFPVVYFSLGNTAAEALATAVDSAVVQSTNARLHFQNGQLQSIEKTTTNLDETCTIAGLEVQSDQLLGIATIIGYFLKTQPQWSTVAHQKRLKSQYTQYHLFRRGVRSSIALLLLGLLLNFILFLSYSHEINDLQAYVSEASLDQERTDRLKGLIGDMEKIVQSIEDAASTRSGWYLHQLSTSIPTSVWLDQLEYQPLVQRIQTDQLIEVSPAIITIKGMTKSTIDFTQWIDQLEAMQWIATVTLLQYGTVARGKTNFSVMIAVNPEEK